MFLEHYRCDGPGYSFQCLLAVEVVEAQFLRCWYWFLRTASVEILTINFFDDNEFRGRRYPLIFEMVRCVHELKSNLFYGIRRQCSFIMLKDVVDEYVPTIKYGISQSSLRMWHHAAIFLSKKNLLKVSQIRTTYVGYRLINLFVPSCQISFRSALLVVVNFHSSINDMFLYVLSAQDSCRIN